MNIEIHENEPSLIEKFKDKSLVFRLKCIDTISNETRDIGIVTDYDDYIRKLKSHLYIPILYTLDFYSQLSYLFGCLNLEYGVPRKFIFIFWKRFVGESEWSKWFTVHPYRDKLI